MKKNSVITIVIALLFCVVFLGFNPLRVNADGDKQESNSENPYFENPVKVTFVGTSGTTELWLNADSSIGRDNFPSPIPEGGPAAEGEEWYWADANGDEFTADTPVSSNMEVRAVSRQKVRVTFIDYYGNEKEVKELYAGSTIEELPSAEPADASSFVSGKEWYWIDENNNEFTTNTTVTSVMEVRAVWTQNVIFDGSDTITVHSYSLSESDVNFPELPDSEKEGGWKNGDHIYEVGSSLILNGDVIAARFSPYYKVTVTFDVNQGTDFINNSGYAHTAAQEIDVEGRNVTVYKIHVYPGTTINLDQFKTVGRQNRTFLAWTNVPKNQRSQKYISEITPDTDVHVYGMWGSTITFVSNKNIEVAKYIGYVGGNNSWIAEPPETVDGITVGTSFIIPDPRIPSGRTFDYWVGTQGNTTIKYYQGDIGQSKSFLQNSITFYPVFKESLKVTFDNNGGGDVPKPNKYLPGDEVWEEASRRGYEFLGWNTDKFAETGQVPYIIPEDQTTDLTLYAIWRQYDPNTKFGLLLDSKDLPADPTASSLDVSLFTSGKISQSETSVAVWETVNVLRKDNIIGGAQTKTADTTIEYEAPDQKVNYVSNDVTGALKQLPDNDEIARIFPTYDSDTQFVLWYYLQTKTKKIGGEEYRHVDGAILDKKINITVTAEDKNKFYGENDPELTLTASAEDINENDITVKVGYDQENRNWYVKTEKNERLLATCTLSIGTEGVVDQNGNTLYNIEPACSSALEGKFIVSKTNGTLTVKPVVTVTAPDQTKVYGTSDNLTATIKLNGVDQGAECSGNVCKVENNPSMPNITCTLGHDGGDDVGDDHPITASCTALPANYRVVKNLGKLTITRQGITVTADYAEKIYKTDDPQFTYTVTKTGTKDVDGLAVTVTRPDAAKQINADTYEGALVPAVTINGQVPDEHGRCGNYVVVTQNGDFKINPRPVTITPDAKENIYGESGKKLTATVKMGDESLVSTCVNSQCTEYSVNTGLGENPDPIKYSISREPGVNAGTYKITVSVTSKTDNYSITCNEGTYTITPAEVEITIDEQTKVYGEKDPELTAQVTGTVGQDSIIYELNRVEGENVGNYAITAQYNEDQGNYKVTRVVPNKLIITPFEVTVTAVSTKKVYGKEDPAFTYTVTKSGTKEPAAVDGLAVTVTRPDKDNQIDVDTYEGALVPSVEIKGQVPDEHGLCGNYKVVTQNGNFEIKPMNITITAGSKTDFIYNGKDQTLAEGDYSVDPKTLPYGDTVKNVGLSGSIHNVGEVVSSEVIDGSWVIVNRQNKNVNSNYSVERKTGTLSMQPLPLTIRAANDSKVYDGTPLTCKDSSCKKPYYTHEPAVIPDELTEVVVKGEQLNVGTADNEVISWKFADDANVRRNYAVSTEKGTLIVSASDREVLIKGHTVRKVYDAEPLTCTDADCYDVSGLAEGDRLDSIDVMGSQTTANEGNPTPNVLSHPHFVNAAGEDVADNYSNVRIEDGELIVLPKRMSLATGSRTVEYNGTALRVNSYTPLGLAGEDHVDRRSVHITGSQTNAGRSNNTIQQNAVRILNRNNEDVTGSYIIDFFTGTLTVTPKPVTVTVDSDPATAMQEKFEKEFGQRDPAFTARVTGTLAGDTVEYEFSREEGEEPGDYVINVFDPKGRAENIKGNYVVTFVPGILTINYNNISYTAAKVWVDDNNRDGIRPVSLSVSLIGSDGTVRSRRLSDANGWTATIDDLSSFAGGRPVTYYWTEEDVDGYTGESEVNGNVTTFTNTHEVARTTASVTKVWDDKNNAGNNRPSSLGVVLQANGERILGRTLNDGNNWSQTVENLPVNDKGRPINYVWFEQSVGGGYYAVSSTTSGNTTTLVNSNLYTLTIHYRFADETQAAPDHVDQLAAGEVFTVDSPAVRNYVTTQTTVAGVMPGRDMEITVYYAREGEAVVTPTPTPMPRPDDKDKPDQGETFIKGLLEPLGLEADEQHTLVIPVPNILVEIDGYETALGLGEVFLSGSGYTIE